MATSNNWFRRENENLRMDGKASEVSSIVINTANFRNEARRRKARSQQKSKLFEVAIYHYTGANLITSLPFQNLPRKSRSPEQHRSRNNCLFRRTAFP